VFCVSALLLSVVCVFWIVEGSCFLGLFLCLAFFPPGERARRKISSLIQFVMQG
jgi:hypothetical protein